MTAKPAARAAKTRSLGLGGVRPTHDRGGHEPSTARVSLSSVLINWAALVALWALPYLTLLDHLRPDAARSELLQWSLLGIGVLGIASLLLTAWRDTHDPAWRAKHKLVSRQPPGRMN